LEKQKISEGSFFFKNSTKESIAVEEKASADYSETNLQVSGIDEGDIVKTDRNYIYHVGEQRINITRVFPARDMEIMSKITYDSTNLSPIQLFIHGEELIVISSAFYKKLKIFLLIVVKFPQ
jgi:inhibitor of cysteine peptidase